MATPQDREADARCKARRRFRASFNGAVSVIFLLGEFTWQILTWRLRLPLLPKFLGTSTGVPNRSHGSAATACHIRFAVDFAQRGRQYFAREMFPVVGTLILSAGRRIHAIQPVSSRERHETDHVSTNRKNCIVY
jgi:hypothetical protein